MFNFLYINRVLYYKNNSLLKLNYLIYVTIITIFTFTMWLNVFIFNLKITHLLIFIAVMVFILNLFAYFLTIYNSSKYTTQIKFFWIRVYNIIWMLEFYLIVLFLILYIISPSELKFFFEPNQQIKISLPNINNIFVYIQLLLMSTLINYYCVYNTYNNKLISNTINIIVAFVSVNVFLSEIRSYFYYLQISSFKKTNFITTTDKKTDLFIKNTLLFQNNGDVRHHIPSIFILNLILGVKFFHLYLIILINFIILYLFNVNRINLEVVGLWQQNITILFIFGLLNYVVFFKSIYKTLFYGFYKNISLLDSHNTDILLYEFYII